jgi:tetratricopeptide (TPR) repeat protein
MPSLTFRSVVVALAAAGAACGAPRQSAQPAPATAAPAIAAPATGAPDAPTASAEERRQLLSRAFEIARRFPDKPFIKDRAKYEGLVVDACLERGELDRAEEFAERSCFTWRRAESFALVAARRAAAGDRQAASRGIDRALGELDRLEEAPDWARERVRASCARVALRLGDPARAATLLSTDAPALEAGYAAYRAEVASPEELDASADSFDRGIATQNFDLARAGLDGYLAILARSRDDAPRRERAVRALRAGIPGLPRDLQVQYMLRTSDALAAVGLAEDALAEAERARAAFAGAEFLPEDRGPIGAPVAAAFARLGRREAALAQLDALEADFRRLSDRIPDFERARPLRAMAEASAAAGDVPRAGRLYAEAVEVGALNPNARPRAEDLCATCISMAGSGIAAGEPVLARIRAIEAALADPW